MKKLLVLILVLPIGYCTVVGNLARHKAEDICSAMPANATASAAEAVLSKAGIPELKKNDPLWHEKSREPYWYQDTYGMGLIVVGVFPSFLGERWVCRVRFEPDKMPDKELRLID